MYHQTFCGSFQPFILYHQHPSRFVLLVSIFFFTHSCIVLPPLPHPPSWLRSTLIVSLSRSPAFSRTALFMTAPIP